MLGWYLVGKPLQRMPGKGREKERAGHPLASAAVLTNIIWSEGQVQGSPTLAQAIRRESLTPVTIGCTPRESYDNTPSKIGKSACS